MTFSGGNRASRHQEKSMRQNENNQTDETGDSLPISTSQLEAA